MGYELFNQLAGTVDTLANRCDSEPKNDGGKFMCPTDVYNEGWMLKLTLAFLIGMPDDANLSEDLKQIRDAAKAGWMAEGRLHPAFEHEQCTHADAVLGDIEVDKDKKWCATLKEDATKFVVIEAKLGSNLSKGTKNAKDFDQAARTVACMAYEMAKKGNQDVSASYYLLLPEKDKNKNLNMVECAPNKAKEEASGKEKEGHLFRSTTDGRKTKFYKSCGSITCKMLTWEDIVKELSKKGSDEAKWLKGYYSADPNRPRKVMQVVEEV